MSKEYFSYISSFRIPIAALDDWATDGAKDPTNDVNGYLKDFRSDRVKAINTHVVGKYLYIMVTTECREK